MEEWHGIVNWPIDEYWQCEICGGTSLVWGLVNGACQCDKCHTNYSMRNSEKQVVTWPISLLRPEYVQPAKWIFEKYAKPISQVSDDEWDEAIEATKA